MTFCIATVSCDNKLRRNTVVLLMKTNLDQLMNNGTKQLGTNQSKLWN